jgi:hypothetical protein
VRPLLLALAACCVAAQAAPPPPPPPPPLDLALAYYSRVLTPDGVTREARYQERMLRRPGHVWSGRDLPAGVPAAPHAGHAEFNPALLARHVVLEQGAPRVEFVDRRAREVIAIPPSEYGSIGFDGSWENACYLLDPARVMRLPLSARVSAVAGAQWREREQNGVFERVLWDGRRQVALVVESGDRAGTVLRRIEVSVLPGLAASVPWQQLGGYAHKEYADFLD